MDTSRTVFIPSLEDVHFVSPSETAAQPVLSIDDGTMYGLSFFETFHVTDRVLFLDEHLSRLNASLSCFNIPVMIRTDLINELIEHYDLHHTALKLLVSEKNIIASTRPLTYTQAYYERGAKVKISPILRSSRSHLIRHKSSNYGDMILSLREAHQTGWDDVLFFNELGHLTESCIANVFIIKDQVLYTPPLSDGLLPGIIRNHLLQNYTVREMSVTEDVLMNCDGAFLTNSLVGIVKINAINTTTIPDNPLTETLRQRYLDFVKESYGSTH